MIEIDPDDACLCQSGRPWAECCGQNLPLTLRFVPVRLLTSVDTVRGGCGRGGHCCRGVHVPLTPFDVLRLARSLGISTSQLLSGYAMINGEGIVEIDGEPQCPFLDENSACQVYADRPDSCRRYPFWRISSGGADYLVERHTCAGCWRECRAETWRVGDWVAAAGLEPGRAMEALYHKTLAALEECRLPDSVLEEFMERSYDSDSFPGETGALTERFRRVMEGLRQEYRELASCEEMQSGEADDVD